METKKVTEDFSDRGSPTWDIEAIKSRLTMVEICYEECDAELAKAGLASLGYEAQDMSTMLGHLLLLRKYVENAYDQCYDVLDHPLYKAFTNGATQTLSEIVLDDITTENTFNMQEYVEVSQAYRSMYRNRVKTELTMSDFLGQGALALDLASMTGKEVALELAKMWGVDAIADTASYVAGYTSDALGLPEGVTFLASF